MEIEFDPEKDRQNVKNHGVSLSIAKDLAWDEALAWPDRRFEYDEWRMIAIAPIGNGLYYVSYVDRGEKARIISLRKASNMEKKHYARIHHY